MIGSYLRYLDREQTRLFGSKAFELLAAHGVKLDPHPEMFQHLDQAGAEVDQSSGMVRIPEKVMRELLDAAPKSFRMGARDDECAFDLPRPEGRIYARTCTGGHGYIDPDSGDYRKLTKADLSAWAKLVGQLEHITFMPYMFCDDVPTQTADVHGLATILKNCAKHAWVQPYTAESVSHLIKLGQAAAGGPEALKLNPLISMITCSLTPRAFKHMDIEAIQQSVNAGVPIQACSLPGAGGTSPATMAGTALLAVTEIMAMVAMAQAIRPGAQVVACPIIFSTDMRTGRSLQTSVEAMRGASLAVQFIKDELGLPTHNYGSGADSPVPDEQSMSERAMLTTLMAASGSDILGGAGQLEVATVVSPLQLLVDNEVLGMAGGMVAGFDLTEDQLAWEVLTQTEPGQHFMTSPHTFQHCRDGHEPVNFVRDTRENWIGRGSKGLMARLKDSYAALMAKDNPGRAAEKLVAQLDDLVSEADRQLIQ
jgi:trimethylamine--corrinoid protein Co-methyltransferase